MAVEPPPELPGVARDPSSLSGILATLARDGFTSELRPQPGATIECAACGEVSHASLFAVEQLRRMEGASDPDEMVVIAALRCPVCQQGGALVLSYGPEVTDLDAPILEQLPDAPRSRGADDDKEP